MYKFFIASDAQISASKPEHNDKWTVNIYMVKRWAIPLPFNEIKDAMIATFESVIINNHKYWYWFQIEIDELMERFWVEFVERSFELKKEDFII